MEPFQFFTICAVAIFGYFYSAYAYRCGMRDGAEKMVDVLAQQKYINVDCNGNVTSGDRKV